MLNNNINKFWKIVKDKGDKHGFKFLFDLGITKKEFKKLNDLYNKINFVSPFLMVTSLDAFNNALNDILKDYTNEPN
jgi:hypothetical protein